MTKVLTSVVNTNYDMKVGPKHYLYGWAVRHASWIMNRYVPRGVLKKSAYYATRGSEYRGQLVPFGETVMAHWITRANQKAWIRVSSLDGTRPMKRTLLRLKWASSVVVPYGG